MEVSHSLILLLFLTNFLCASVFSYFLVFQCKCYCETVDISEVSTMIFSLPGICVELGREGEKKIRYIVTELY